MSQLRPRLQASRRPHVASFRPYRPYRLYRFWASTPNKFTVPESIENDTRATVESSAHHDDENIPHALNQSHLPFLLSFFSLSNHDNARLICVALAPHSNIAPCASRLRSAKAWSAETLVPRVERATWPISHEPLS